MRLFSIYTPNAHSPSVPENPSGPQIKPMHKCFNQHSNEIPAEGKRSQNECAFMQKPAPA